MGILRRMRVGGDAHDWCAHVWNGSLTRGRAGVLGCVDRGAHPCSNAIHFHRVGHRPNGMVYDAVKLQRFSAAVDSGAMVPFRFAVPIQSYTPLIVGRSDRRWSSIGHK
jgi:hypothetical protein